MQMAEGCLVYFQISRVGSYSVIQMCSFLTFQLVCGIEDQVIMDLIDCMQKAFIKVFTENKEIILALQKLYFLSKLNIMEENETVQSHYARQLYRKLTQTAGGIIAYLYVFGKAVNLELKKISRLGYVIHYPFVGHIFFKQYMPRLSSKNFRISHSKCAPCTFISVKTSLTSQEILFVLLNRSGKETYVLSTNNMQLNLLAGPRGAALYVSDICCHGRKKL